MKDIILSICIPSYNRANFLPQTLASLLIQDKGQFEVVVCDNGSEDQTKDVVQEVMGKFSQFRYFRFEKNVGPDLCFLKSVELATGEYCWLLGDDDIIEPGCIDLILSLIKRHPGISGMTVNRYAYDAQLQNRWLEPPLVPVKDDLLFTESTTCLRSLFVLFGFLSAQIVHRKKWIEVTQTESIAPYFTAYVLVYIIGRMIQKDPYWLYVARPCIGWRSDNDSFAKQLGRYRRFELDIVGYHRILQGLCVSDACLYKYLMDKVARVHLLTHIRDIKLRFEVPCFVRRSLQVLFPRFKSLSVFWCLMLPTILTPCWILQLIRNGYRFCMPIKRGGLCQEKL